MDLNSEWNWYLHMGFDPMYKEGRQWYWDLYSGVFAILRLSFGYWDWPIPFGFPIDDLFGWEPFDLDGVFAAIPNSEAWWIAGMPE